MTMRSSKHLLLAAFALASLTLPALAQPAARVWQPSHETIVVTAGAPKNWHDLFTASRSNYGVFLLIQASLAVPYGDLDLSKSPGVDELDRRIHLAANMVCKELDLKYPPAQYPPATGDDCYLSALNGGLAKANEVVATKR